MGKSVAPSATTLEETLEIFSTDGRTWTPLTATEVAEELGCTRRTAHRKLVRLVERGDIETKKVSASGRVWWRPMDPQGADGNDQRAAEPAPDSPPADDGDGGGGR